MTSQSPDQQPDRRTTQGRRPASTLEILKAQNEGALALLANQSPAACPYRHDRTAKGRYLAMMWFRGWQAKRQASILAAEQLEPEANPAPPPSQPSGEAAASLDPTQPVVEPAAADLAASEGTAATP